MFKTNLGTVVALFCMSVLAVGTSYAQVSTPKAISGEYIVKFKNRPASVSSGLKMISKMSAGVSVKEVFAGAQMMHVKVNSVAAKDALYNSSDVEFIEPNYILSVDPVGVSEMGSAPQSTDSYAQSNSNVQVRQSWDIEKPYDQGNKTIVAVVDTGLDSSHQLFSDSGALWVNEAEKNGRQGIDDDANGYIDDINGWNFVNNTANFYDDNHHGTHVSGIILGVGQDVFAMPVRESKVKIMPLKFLDSSGSGSTASAVSAIYYAVAKGARVINNSWGGPSYSQSLHEAYTYAYNNGVVIASAAGNSNTNNDSVAMYPANLDTPNNISVAATTDSDNKASFSNYGASTVNVAAPGVAILSSVPGTGCLAPGCFQMMSGTSMATPFVAGLAALVIREAPQLSAYQVRSIIIGSVDTFSSLNGKVSSSGRVNALKAITNAIAQVNVAPWSPSYTPDYKSSRSIASEQVQAPVAGCGLVKAVADGGEGGGGSASATDLIIILSVLSLPLVLAFVLRQQPQVVENRVSMADRRAFERFELARQATLQVGEQMLSITTSDVSLGGISFKGDMSLQKGQIVQLQLSEDAVQAEVVWCSKAQVYGLRFLNASENIKDEIQSWTQGMVPTS